MRKLWGKNNPKNPNVKSRCLKQRGFSAMVKAHKKGVISVLNEKIKTMRKNKGLTQEELAVRLNVVRQTVSKWEKGLSVPDAEMLQKLAEVLETTVAKLLDGREEVPLEADQVAQQLARINEQLTIKNRRARRIWTAVAVVAAAYVLLWAAWLVAFGVYSVNPKVEWEVEVIETTP